VASFISQPRRCHRTLIADAMMVRGWAVREIIGAAKLREDKLTPFFKVADGRLTHPDLELNS